MQITELNIYPLKSARRQSLTEAVIEPAGLSGDRSLMLVQPDGTFISQRQVQKLAQLDACLSDGKVTLYIEGRELVSALLPAPSNRMAVKICRSDVNAAVADEHANTAISNWFGQDVKLVYFDSIAERAASEEWAGDNVPIRFSDAYPVLVTTTGSLSALNENMTAHGEEPVNMDRFRPNIVIDHDVPWTEDHWASVEISGVQLDLVKPCDRCIITTQDQQTGYREGPTPMPAMQRIRMSVDPRIVGVLFGWNAVSRNKGTLRVGDDVEVVEHRPEGWALR